MPFIPFFDLIIGFIHPNSEGMAVFLPKSLKASLSPGTTPKKGCRPLSGSEPVL